VDIRAKYFHQAEREKALYIYRAPENGKRKFWGESPAAEVGFPVWI
jgi:hypothetical protein